MSGAPGFAPFDLDAGSIEEDTDTTGQPAAADTLGVADASTADDDRGDSLTRAIKRYATLLRQHGASLSNGFKPSDEIMGHLLGQLANARRQIAQQQTDIDTTGNAAALAAAVRRGLPEDVQPRHDELMRLVERARRARR